MALRLSMPSCPTPNRAITPPGGSASYSGPVYGRGPTITYAAGDSRTAPPRARPRHQAREGTSSPSADTKRGFRLPVFRLGDEHRRPRIRHAAEFSIDSVSDMVPILRATLVPSGLSTHGAARRTRASATKCWRMTMVLAAITYLDRVTHLGYPARHRARSQPQSDADGLRVQRVLPRLRAVRDSHRLVGRPDRHAAGADADRLLVVGVHRAHRRWRSATRRCWRSGFCSAPARPGALPNVARTFSRWFPRQERGTAQGIFFMGAHLAGGLTPLLVTALLVYFSWRIVVRGVRVARVRLGGGLVPMVSRFAGGPSRGRPRRA